MRLYVTYHPDINISTMSNLYINSGDMIKKLLNRREMWTSKTENGRKNLFGAISYPYKSIFRSKFGLYGEN